MMSEQSSIRNDLTGESLAGKTAVVTGSSSGIGRGIALELARAGAEVVVHAATSHAAAEEVVGQIRDLGRQSLLLLADLADSARHEPLVESAWSWRDGVDIWVNNAGADVITGEPAHWSFKKKLELLWQTDVLASVQLSRLIGSRMKRRGNGTILNMGWDQAARGMAGDSGEMFATIKGAVMAFSKSLAQSLAPQVRVNCLAPGWIKTSWGEDASEKWQQRAQGECLLGRWGTPQDVARAARFLVSPASEFITGQIVEVNGGFRFSSSDKA